MIPILVLNDNAMFDLRVPNRPSHCRLLSLLLFIMIQVCLGNQAIADDAPRRIEVYELAQSYWDTKYGDTLSEIAMVLLPNNPYKRESLMQDIVRLNPQAFINGDPQQLLTGRRLALPGYMKQADTRIDPAVTEVETYSWGNIKRPRR